MAWLLARKLALLLLLIPALHAFGFYYALNFGPELVPGGGGILHERSDAPAFVPTYREHLQRAAGGDWGDVQRVPIPKLIANPFKYSLILLGVALALTVVLGPLVGGAALSPQTGRVRPRARLLLTLGSAVPGFFLGSLLIVALIYAARIGLGSGRGTLIPVQGFGLDAHLIVPVLTLAVRPVLSIGQITAGLLENEFQQDYLRVARSKGLSWRRLLWRHALPNIISPVIVSMGQAVRMLVSGLILVEALFDWQGLGRMFVQVVTLSTTRRAAPVFLHPELLSLILVFFGALLLMADLLANVIAYAADPRLRHTTDNRPAVA